MLLTISYSESTYLITPEQPLKPYFYEILYFVYFLVVNNNKINHVLLTISYSELTFLITAGQLLKPRFYEILYFVHFLVVNNNKN